jgi:hypothetical protein
MKFDEKSLEILKNFASINPSIKFQKGSTLKTVNQLLTIMAKANIVEVEQDFCIGELNRFMSAMSLFNEPEIDLKDKLCVIKDGNNKLEYVYTAEELIKVAPENDIKLPSIDVEFILKNEVYQLVRKAMSVLSLTEMAFVGTKGKLIVKAFNSKGVTEDNYAIEIGKTDKDFIVVFKAENLKLLPYDYSVSISSKGISTFKSDDVQYWIAIEAGESKFE